MISSDAFGLIELVGVFGLVIGVLGWQWISIRRTLKADRDKAEREEVRRGGPQEPSS